MGVSDQGLCLLEFAERRMLDTQLKRLRAQKELQGEPCHLSDLVRQALDDFLKQAKALKTLFGFLDEYLVEGIAF